MKRDAKSAGKRAVESRLQRTSGRHNPRLKELRQAFRRGELTAAGECAIEGTKLVEEAIRSGQHLTGIFFSESARNLVEKFLPQIGTRVDILVLPDALFKSIVPSETPQGVAALVIIRVTAAQQILTVRQAGPSSLPPDCKTRATWDDPRSAEAFGGAGAFFTEGTVSPTTRKSCAARQDRSSLARSADRFRRTDSTIASARRATNRNLIT
jgi:TrmH family RNA methyltransferase